MAIANRLLPWNFEVANAGAFTQPLMQGIEAGYRDRQQGIENQRANRLLDLQVAQGDLARQKFGIEQQRFQREMDRAKVIDPLEEQRIRAGIDQTRASTAAAASATSRAQAEHNSRMAQFEAMTPEQRAKVAPTLGLQPETPAFYAFVAGGKLPSPENTNTAQQPTWGVDENNNPVIMQLNRSGAAVRTALPPGVRPVPPGDLAFDKAQGQERGEAFGKGVANLSKAENAYKTYETQQRVVEQDIDRVLKGTNWATTGWVGKVGTYVPGTPAYDLARTLDTIKANIGFDKLAEMRANSPTGGALGAVTEFENKLLQSVLGSLEQSQSPEQLRYNLQRLKDTIGQMRTQRLEALEADRRQYGAMARTPPAVLRSPQAQPPAQQAPEPSAPAAPTRAQAPQAQQGAPVRVTSPQEAAALPPGTRFIGHDGIERIKR